jgi:hypothetical protein
MAAKNLSHVINEHPQFLAEFKKCVYEERSVAYNELLVKYNLEDNSWLNNSIMYSRKGFEENYILLSS